MKPETELDDDAESQRPLNWGDGVAGIPMKTMARRSPTIRFRTAAAAAVTLKAVKPKFRKQRSVTAKRLPLQEAMKNGNSEIAFCSTSELLASTRWVRLTFSILCPLYSKQCQH